MFIGVGGCHVCDGVVLVGEGRVMVSSLLSGGSSLGGSGVEAQHHVQADVC